MQKVLRERERVILLGLHVIWGEGERYCEQSASFVEHTEENNTLSLLSYVRMYSDCTVALHFCRRKYHMVHCIDSNDI